VIENWRKCKRTGRSTVDQNSEGRLSQRFKSCKIVDRGSSTKTLRRFTLKMTPNCVECFKRLVGKTKHELWGQKMDVSQLVSQRSDAGRGRNRKTKKKKKKHLLKLKRVHWNASAKKQMERRNGYCATDVVLFVNSSYPVTDLDPKYHQMDHILSVVVHHNSYRSSNLQWKKHQTMNYYH
jgi:hypothetical protein